MPAPSWRMRPARSMSLWLSASASAGSSRRVWTSDCERRTATRYPSSGGAPPPSVVVGRGRRPCSLPLGDEPVDLLAHRLHDVLLGDLTDDLAVLEDEADPAPARHADVGGTRLTGAVDLAPHNSDMDLLVQPAELVLNLLREFDQVDVGAAA